MHTFSYCALKLPLSLQLVPWGLLNILSASFQIPLELGSQFLCQSLHAFSSFKGFLCTPRDILLLSKNIHHHSETVCGAGMYYPNPSARDLARGPALVPFHPYYECGSPPHRKSLVSTRVFRVVSPPPCHPAGLREGGGGYDSGSTGRSSEIYLEQPL